MSELPRNVTKMRSSAYFHIKSAAAHVDTDESSDDEIIRAQRLLEMALDKLDEFIEARASYLAAHQPPELI